ncbi:MAG: dihydroorotase [Muribaculaceae bacterium]|nr:dihydroorotase [Muribaculaceae bacterium]
MLYHELPAEDLPKHYIISNCRWVDKDGASEGTSIEVIDGKIARIERGSHILPENIETPEYNMGGKLVTYGLCDVHVHLRQPGFEAKETISTGTIAAMMGGYTAVCAMPNLNPTPDSVEHIGEEIGHIKEDAAIDVYPYAAITVDRKGRQLVDMATLRQYAIAFSDDGSGVQNEEMMKDAMKEAARLDVIIAAHCEVNDLLKGGYIHDGEYCLTNGHKGICSESEWGQIARDLKLAEETGCRYHVCHISTKESVELIREAKKRGVKVTCETGPHYLVFCDKDLKDEGRFKMNPPIRSKEDRDALIEGIIDGTIDCIATDHAPHTAEEKSRGLKGSAMGVVGLETAFGVCYTHLVNSGVITIEKLVQLMCLNPRRIFGLEADGEANFAVFDLDRKWTVDSKKFASMGKATPFEWMELHGKPFRLIYDGKLIDLIFQGRFQQNNP